MERTCCIMSVIRPGEVFSEEVVKEAKRLYEEAQPVADEASCWEDLDPWLKILWCKSVQGELPKR
jgi:hypothetical protein